MLRDPNTRFVLPARRRMRNGFPKWEVRLEFVHRPSHLVQIIALKILREFWQSHASAEASLRAWYHEARIADWRSFQDIKKRYSHADVLPSNRVVFDIKGNTYRLVARINYQSGCIFIRFVGTHAAYDKIDPRTI